MIRTCLIASVGFVLFRLVSFLNLRQTYDMLSRRFLRRLDEALTTVGGGIDVPVDVNDDHGDDDSDFELTPDQIKALYKWVKGSNDSLLAPILGVMERLDPQVSVGLKVTDRAGVGNTIFWGHALCKAIWRIRHDDPGRDEIESEFVMILRRSDLWKALGVGYERAQSFFNNEHFWSHFYPAVAYKLSGMKHAGFWAHISKDSIDRQVRSKIVENLGRQDDARLVRDPGSLKAHGVGWRSEPGSLKISSDGKMSSVEPDRAHGDLFVLMASVNYSFSGSVDLLRSESEDLLRSESDAFGHLDRSTQSAIVSGLVSVIEAAWDDGMGEDLQVRLNPSGGERATYWEPAVAPDYDVEVDPDVLEYTITDWADYFEDVDPGVLASALGSIPPRVLHLIRKDVDVSNLVVDVDDVDDVPAELLLSSASLTGSGLTVTVTVKVRI